MSPSASVSMEDGLINYETHQVYCTHKCGDHEAEDDQSEAETAGSLLRCGLTVGWLHDGLSAEGRCDFRAC